MKKIRFKKNNAMGGRHESNIKTADGYQAKFIITESNDYKGTYVLRVYDPSGTNGNYYIYAKWAWTGIKTIKGLVEWINEAYETTPEANPTFATWSCIGYAE